MYCAIYSHLSIAKYCKPASIMFAFLLALLYSTLSANLVNCETYIIATSQSTCPIESQLQCFTLSQFAANYSHLVRVKTALQILPGNHSLEVFLTVKNIIFFSISPSSGDFSSLVKPVITCDLSMEIQFDSIVHVLIEGITFIGCVQTKVHAVKHFIILATDLSGNGVPGTALLVSKSIVHTENCSFTRFCRSLSSVLQHNNEVTGPGVIACTESHIWISNSTFTHNRGGHGHAISAQSCSILIVSSTFFLHTQINKGYTHYGGVIVSNTSNTTTIGCTFNDNNGGFQGLEGGVLRSLWSNITIYLSTFTNNSAESGGILHSDASKVTISSSLFSNNRADIYGGVFNVGNSTLIVNNSSFSENEASGECAVLYTFEKSSVFIESCFFHQNKAIIGGGLCIWHNSHLFINGQNKFLNNFAFQYGSAIHVYFGSVDANGTLSIIGNVAKLESVALLHSYGNLSGTLLMANNTGSLFAYDSDLIITGNIILSNNTPTGNRSADLDIQEGGGITSFLSTITLNGVIVFKHNCATNGGGILAAASKMWIGGEIYMTHNAATDTGGGIYLYQTELKLQGDTNITQNTASKRGGGVHAIASSIMLALYQIRHSSSKLHVFSNSAERGGGICFEASSKLYVMSNVRDIVYFEHNMADYGGAIFVDDKRNIGTCNSSYSLIVTEISESECFFQVVTVNSRVTIIDNTMAFSHNSARSLGGILFGGLLDRCTVNSFGTKSIKYAEQDGAFNGILNNTASYPVRVCFCTSHNNMNCTYQPKDIKVLKGNNFTITLASVDQVNHTVDATIHSYLYYKTSRLGKGQQAQTIASTCTNLTFKVYSKEDSEILTVYSGGPCKDIGISKRSIGIHFIPCKCPIGFKKSNKTYKCDCVCDPRLKQFISNCNISTKCLIRNGKFWMTIVNSTNKILFLIYPHCPFDYCYPATQTVCLNFNIHNGADAQCASNRVGKLCGVCKTGLSLSLGSSRCLTCPTYWPALFGVIIVAFTVGGITLVVVILGLNLTVATGTLNGLIFYANIVFANVSLFMPFQTPNFHTVFIYWMNLRLGLDVCFIQGMDVYVKTWLHLAFPIYVMLLVIMIIFISRISGRFANIIGRRNPVATLATLLLLSYAELLQSIIAVFSFASLDYPDHTEVVWLPDASIKYLTGKHIPLFIVAVVILVFGIAYTVLLTTWQWLLPLSDKWMFQWVKNTKLTSFMDAYHAPYNARSRYWTGLLLLVRVILYLSSALNLSREPKVNFTVIIVAVCSLLALAALQIYKKVLLTIIEIASYYNIVIFSIAKFYLLDKDSENHKAVAYASVSISFIMFVCIIAYHICTQCCLKSCLECVHYQHNSLRLHSPLNCAGRSHPRSVTYSEVDLSHCKNSKEGSQQ